MRSHRRSPRPVAIAIDAIRDELAPATVLADVQRVWLEAVGPTIANDARPISERMGVLTISCSASVWAQELDLMSAAILEGLNQRLHEGRICRLRCVALPAR
ncbi:MAG: DUF721 domain-containing protein [Solirubrobacteraceae bacterium]